MSSAPWGACRTRAGMVIMALPVWQSHFSIAAIGNLYVAPSRAFRAVRLQLCAINPVNGDPHGARQVYITNVRNQGMACSIHG